MPWYSTGTVTVTNNSATVTGAGTNFSANGRVGDAFRGPDGYWYEVTNIASATVLTIKPNYQGANNAAGSYAIAPMQGYVKDSADALRSFVNQYGATLASLGPWSTAQTPADARVAMGINFTSSTSDTTTGRVPTVGWAGLGGAGVTPGGLTAPSDSPFLSGFYAWGNTPPAGSPVAGAGVMIRGMHRSDLGGSGCDVVLARDVARMFIRGFTNGVPTQFVEMVKTDDTRLGTLNGKSGGSVSGDATFQKPRTSSTTGQSNSGGGVSSGFSNGAGAFRMYLEEIVNTAVQGVLYATNGAAGSWWTFNITGNATALSGSWVNGSDIRIKDDVQQVQGALSAVLSWRGSSWQYKDGAFGIGLTVQDVERHCPGAVEVVPGRREFSDGTVVENPKSLNTAGVAAAYHNEAIRTLFELLDLALNDPDTARTRIEAIKAEILTAA